MTDALIEIRRRLDDRNAAWFDLHFNRFVETLNTLVTTTSKGSFILETGSFPGYLTALIKKLGYDVHGVDIEPDAVNEFLKDEQIEIRKCDLEKDMIPFEDEMFDVVLFTEVLEHLNYYRVDYVLGEVKRVLKQNGTLILSTPNLAALENRIFLLKGGSSHLGGGIISPAHNREYTMTEVLNILQKNGFKVQRLWYSLARDIVTHTAGNTFSTEHVLRGWIKHRHWINVGRAIAYPFKLAMPSLRAAMFVIASRPARTRSLPFA